MVNKRLAEMTYEEIEDLYRQLGSFRKCARELGCTHPTFSRHYSEKKRDLASRSQWKQPEQRFPEPADFHRAQKLAKRETKSSSSKLFLDPDEMRVACFDIESTGLRGDFGVVLCCVIKPFGSRSTRDVFSVDFDHHDLLCAEHDMLIDIRDCLQEYDGVTTYYGSKFDLPMLRTRMMYHGIKPNIPKMKHLDAYYTAKRNINTSSRRMERIGDVMRRSSVPELPSKTRLDIDIWIRATHGRDKQAQSYIIDHCVHDVDLLEGIVQYFYDQGWVPDRILRM
jgi:uncharacterized protein YprB with RNaseH-like and TPR domain